jgi:hypothetical protein
MRYKLILFCLFTAFVCKAQTDSVKSFTFSGYAELYYSYDFSSPENHEKPNFLYNYKRHNELNLNLAYAKASYITQNIRGNLALMFGNYAQYNMSAEPTWAQFIYEGNLGVKLSKKHKIWLDAGILPSHIGFESAVGADCWTLTRSILAENSPYFETGLKLSYSNKNEHLNTALFVLNGWQRIRKPDAIQMPSLGLQINYKPNNKLTLNYSNFIGSDKPDSLNAIRVFHNFYAIYEPTSKLGLTLGFDIGSDKYNSTDYGYWYSPALIARYTINSKNKLALRLEYYNDDNQIIIPTNTLNGFQTFGTSLNYDYEISEGILWRTEYKVYYSPNQLFLNNSNQNSSFTTSLSLKL